jgi:hypothetical protein
VSFATGVYPILMANCLGMGCHTGARPAASLRLDSASAAWSELVNVPASCGGQMLVRPGAPAQSYLINKLTNVGICSGTQMPKSDQPLQPSDIALIEAWICNGAAND